MSTDLTAPTDPIMADSVAALAVIRAGFTIAHHAVSEESARFAADIERLVAGAAGWEHVLELARQATP